MAAQVRVQVPSSVARWSARPAPFSTRNHGRNVTFSVDNSVAERVDVSNGWDAVVYTAVLLPLGRVWQTTILSTSRGWNGGLVSGCVLCFLECLRLYTDHCTIMTVQSVAYIVVGVVYNWASGSEPT